MLNAFRGVPIQLADSGKTGDGVPSRVQILQVGTYFHEDHGELKITPEIIQQMVVNFNANARGVDLAMDYSHNSGDIAAGWFKKLFTEAEDTQLWADIEWTPAAAKRLEDKEFRYVSADFSFEYQDNETLRKFGPTLFGAALTNRPFLKNMAPAMELTEGEGPDMSKDKKLSDGTTQTADPAAPAAPDMAAQMADLVKKMAELQGKVDSLMGENAQLKEANAKQAEAVKAADKTRKFDILLSEGKVVEAQRKPYVEGDLEEFTAKAGKIKLAEIGSGKDPKETESTEITTAEQAQVEVLKLARVKLAEKKVSDIGQAIGLVLSENKKLSNLYHGRTA